MILLVKRRCTNWWRVGKQSKLEGALRHQDGSQSKLARDDEESLVTNRVGTLKVLIMLIMWNVTNDVTDLV